jgi:hypothetical protein
MDDDLVALNNHFRLVHITTINRQRSNEDIQRWQDKRVELNKTLERNGNAPRMRLSLFIIKLDCLHSTQYRADEKKLSRQSFPSSNLVNVMSIKISILIAHS